MSYCNSVILNLSIVDLKDIWELDLPPVFVVYFQDAVEARMKAEQRIMEGVDGILSSLSEQDQGKHTHYGEPVRMDGAASVPPTGSGLVGDGNEVAGPVSANGI